MRRDRHFSFDNPGGHDQVASFVGEHGWRAFERPLPEVLFLAAQQRPGLVVDVGSNTGFYSLLAATADPGNHVLAFEPVRGIREIAVRNAALNSVADRMTWFDVALSDVEAMSDLYIPPDDHGLVETSASLEATFKPTHSAVIKVQTRRLDTILFGPAYRWRRVSVIKIDVEGHEAAVLDGGFWTLMLRRPIVFVEVLSRSDVERLRRLIRRAGYVACKLLPDRPVDRATTLEYDAEAWNHALVPWERLAGFLSAARALAPTF